MNDTGEKDSGLSLGETEALFGAECINARLEAEIEKAKAHLVSVIAQRDGFVSQRNDFFTELESQDAEIGRLRKTLEHLSNESNYVFDEEGVYYALKRPNWPLLDGSSRLVNAWAFAKAALGQVEERE